MNQSIRRTSTTILALVAASLFAMSGAVLAQDKPAKAALYALQDAFSAVAEEVEPAVVTITARKTVRPVLGTAAPEEDDPLRGTRSEEHTSELQSRLHLVCRLLLEKKKQKK